jgi:LmbE family N-acetylglucosaminyl deacetylase
MIPLQLDQLTTILCLGAHPDDIEIGCGGTILELLSARPGIQVHWIVLSGDETRADEAVGSAERFLQQAGRKEIIVESFRDSFFPYEGMAVKEYFRRLQRRVTPDLIFTHRREDMHQDHRLVAELTWNTFRNHLIFEYEIPKYEGDLGAPNVLTPLSEDTCRQKVDAIVECFPSQHDKPWFSRDTFWSLLRLRGLECHSPSNFAEGLYCRKAVFTASPAIRGDKEKHECEPAICAPPVKVDASLCDANRVTR